MLPPNKLLLRLLQLYCTDNKMTILCIISGLGENYTVFAHNEQSSSEDASFWHNENSDILICILGVKILALVRGAGVARCFKIRHH